MTSLKCRIRRALTRADLYEGKAEVTRAAGDEAGARRLVDLGREQREIAKKLKAQEDAK